MHPSHKRHRWFVVIVFFLFMLLHQADKLLIGPLTTPIMETFGINEEQMGRVFTGALIVGAVLYPLWGYLYDRYARAKLLALAAFIWGSTTWLSALAPTFPLFVASRATTGIDDSSYPGLYSLIADYFAPNVRGKIYGFLQLSAPLGYLLGMILGLMLSEALGWRGIFHLTGGLGIVLSAVIFFSVREAPRGQSEPELADLAETGQFRFEWRVARDLFRKPTLRILFVQGFFGVFPWNVITYWFFRYLEVERNYEPEAILGTMVIAVLVLAAGYPLGGALGDFFFRRNPRGRVLTSAFGVLMGALLLIVAMQTPIAETTRFTIMLALVSLFIPIAAPNLVSTVYDITLPEVRSTALAIQYFIESAGAATAPWLAGYLAVRYSLADAILWICVSTWLLCFVFYLVTAIFVPRDIAILREQLRARAENIVEAKSVI